MPLRQPGAAAHEMLTHAGAEAMGVPVAECKAREDEIRHGFYRPAAIQRFTTRHNENNKPLSWHHCSVFPTILSTFDPSAVLPVAFEMGQSATRVPSDIPHIKITSTPIKSTLRSG